MTEEHKADVAAVPPTVLDAVRRADRPDGGPQPGELWRARAGGGPATLLLVHSAGREGLVAVPVYFDVELADEHTLIVEAASSPLGIPLAIHLSVETSIDSHVLLDRLGTVDTATGSLAGAPVTSALDGRIEYRHALTDEMALLAATTNADDGGRDQEPWSLVDTQSGSAAVLMAMHEALAGTHPGARITPRPAPTSGSPHLDAVAMVAELDAFVLVAAAGQPLDGQQLLEAARLALQADQLLNAVCVVERDAPFMAVVIHRRDVVEAIETPSGEVRAAREGGPSTSLGDALVKFLDVTISPFGQLAGAMVGGQAVDARGLAVDVAGEAVRAVEASARSFKAEGKRPGYERVRRHQASIVRLVEQALSGEEVDVAAIVEDDE